MVSCSPGSSDAKASSLRALKLSLDGGNATTRLIFCGKARSTTKSLGMKRTHLLPIMAICVSLASAAAFADTPREREFRSGDYEEIMNKASCLSLLSNAVIVWNTMAIMKVVTNSGPLVKPSRMRPWRGSHS